MNNRPLADYIIGSTVAIAFFALIWSTFSSRVPGTLDDMLFFVAFFGLLVGIGGGLILALKRKKAAWGVAAFASIAGLIYLVWLIFANAMGHWH